MPTSYPDEIIQDFVIELKSYIPRLKNLVVGIHLDEGRKGRLEESRQLVNSIKGAAVMMGISGLSQIASEWEKTLDWLLAGRLRLDADVEGEMGKILEILHVFATGLSAGDFEEEKLAEEAVGGLRKLREAPNDSASGKSNNISGGYEKTGATLYSSEMEGPVGGASEPETNQKGGKSGGRHNERSSSEFDMLLDDDEDADEEMDIEAVFGALESDSAPDVQSMKNDLLDGFYLEAEEHLQNLEKGLQVLESEILEPGRITTSQRDQLRQIRRSVHTLKGAASIVGIQKPAAWAHEVEDFLDWLYDSASDISPEILMVLARAADLLDGYVNQPESAKPDVEKELQGRFAELMTTVSDEETRGGDHQDQAVPPYSAADLESISFEGASHDREPDRRATSLKTSRIIRVERSKIDSLANLAGELVITLSAFDQRMKYLNSAIEELDLTRNRLREAARDLELGYEIKAIQKLGSIAGTTVNDVNAAAWPQQMNEFDSLEMDRYSEFNLIIRAINESVVDVGALNVEFSNLRGDFDGYINRQRNLLSELQTDITRVRLSPMTIITGRLRRTVRETADQLKKKVRLVIEGEGIELDRTVWEKLIDPLMHMLRNAIDHGIELPAARLEAGKPETGVITVNAAYVGQHVSIRISDDGRGLDYEAIRDRMRTTGKMKQGLNLSEEELAAFVFHQGFSTRRNVTEISGRGVGLDVVKENITGLQGTVRVAGSDPGHGTRFDIVIPLTVGMLRAILFSINGCVFAVPLRDVREIVRIEAQQWIHEPALALRFAGDIIPFYQLTGLLGQADADPAEAEITDNPVVMVVDTGAWRGAVAVDALIGQREIVVKNIGTHLRSVRGVSGATIAGDGKVVPILNLAELLDVGAVDASLPPMKKVSAREQPLEILVVDDSVSVRQVVARLLDTRGWKTDTARDGVEALEKLPLFQPDLIILDLEMPRMNGYEFLSAVQAQEEYRHIPVIMLTSRAADKHRQKALSLGARAYVVKPFDHSDFLDLIERLATPGES